MLKYALLALIILPMVGLAEAKTITFKEAYQDIYLYGGDRLTILNDDSVPHSITSYNQTYHSFDSELVQPNGQTSFGFATDGDFAFYDSRNPSLNGTIHVRTTETPQARLSVSETNVKAGDTYNIYGDDYPTGKDVYVDIIQPDGNILQTLNVKPTSDGKLYIPVTTQRTAENGVYTLQTHTGESTALIITGGVTPDNPTEQAPPSTPVSSGGNTVGQNNNTTTGNQTTTNSTITIQNKQALIDYLKLQIQLLQQLLAMVEAS